MPRHRRGWGRVQCVPIAKQPRWPLCKAISLLRTFKKYPDDMKNLPEAGGLPSPTKATKGTPPARTDRPYVASFRALRPISRGRPMIHTQGTQNKVTGGICAFRRPYTQTAPTPAQSGERHDVCIPGSSPIDPDHQGDTFWSVALSNIGGLRKASSAQTQRGNRSTCQGRRQNVPLGYRNPTIKLPT